MKKNAKTKTQLLLEIDELRTRLEVAEETLRTLQGGDKVTLKEIAHLKKANETFAQLASFPELNPNPIMEIDLAGNVYYLNPAAKQLFPDLQTTGPHHPSLSDLSSLIEMFKHQGKSSIIRELKINDSWYEQAIYYVSENNRLRIYGRDITDRKRTDETLQNALKETDQRRAEISALLEASRAVLENRKFKDAARAIFDSCKNLIGANAGYVALLTKDGTENEVLFLDSGGLRCTVDPNLPMPIRGLREEAYRTGKAVFHNDFPSSGYMKYMPEGHVNLNNVLFAPLAISGKVIGLLGLANKPRGFTENDARMASALGELAAVALHNSRTLESLETSEKHFRSVVQTANDAIISIDKQGNIIFWNNSAENVFGYSTNEVTGKPVTFIIPERFRQIHQKAIHQVVSTDKSNLIGKTIEMTGLKKDCNEFPLELSLAT
jgi:PAS domain S-box-containing protein